MNMNMNTINMNIMNMNIKHSGTPHAVFPHPQEAVLLPVPWTLTFRGHSHAGDAKRRPLPAVCRCHQVAALLRITHHAGSHARTLPEPRPCPGSGGGTCPCACSPGSAAGRGGLHGPGCVLRCMASPRPCTCRCQARGAPGCRGGCGGSSRCGQLPCLPPLLLPCLGSGCTEGQCTDWAAAGMAQVPELHTSVAGAGGNQQLGVGYEQCCGDAVVAAHVGGASTCSAGGGAATAAA